MGHFGAFVAGSLVGGLAMGAFGYARGFSDGMQTADFMAMRNNCFSPNTFAAPQCMPWTCGRGFNQFANGYQRGGDDMLLQLARNGQLTNLSPNQANYVMALNQQRMLRELSQVIYA